MQPEIWQRLREYNNAGFHPNNRDTTKLIERWRSELFAPDGTLTKKLYVAQPHLAAERNEDANVPPNAGYETARSARLGNPATARSAVRARSGT